MTYLEDKINTFFKKRNEIFKKPLEKIIYIMLNKCKYINGESLERHNWGNNPIKLKNIPKNINLPSFEEDLLNALNLEDNEKSIVELLWGDIQLGKRVQACIIMWISVHILKRPVLYIFRNLTIDQKQLQDDIVGTEKYNFNIQFIKTLFQEFNNELQEYFQETNIEYWKDYKLPELKDISSNDIISKLSNKEAINSNDIFCCLMNHTQLAKLNTKFSEYIYYNDELVNITALVDESDLMSPTSSNDRSNDNDKKDSTACEILLAKIYKKVKYALHITGTAHSLLYNVTTRLSDHSNIQTKISRVHKMKRSNDYFGLFNNSINFNTTLVESWWDYQDTENHNKKTCYDIVEDYNINIKRIIENILKRPNVKYNSLLISEEKKRVNQFCLVDKIMKDFPDLFIVIYHGNCLRLYLSKKYEEEIKYWSKWDSKQSSTNQRLCQLGGIYGSSKDTEKSEKLHNNYCYFDINTKILNIKFVYKLLRILFEKSDSEILYKTIVTITGKYGERGYSFTSDDYDNYSLHLTDQYFISHASLNCTDISQRLRLQGKYNDLEVKTGSMKLTLWTSPELQDIIQNFYVKFIKEIEKYIMGCESWEEIKDLLESIIDNGDFKFGKYMKYIDVSKKRKNLKPMKHYDSKHNGYKLIVIDDMNDTEISEWCKETNLTEYKCINEIQQMKINDFLKKYGNPWEINTYFNLTIDDLNKHFEKIGKKEHNPRLDTTGKQVCSLASEKLQVWDYDKLYNKIKNFGNNSTHGIRNGLQSNDKYASRAWVGYDQNGEVKYILKLAIKSNNKFLPKKTTDYIKKTPYFVNGDNVNYSVIKQEYKQQNTHGYTNEKDDNFIEDDNKFPEKYYWKTPDGWLYYYDKMKPRIISLNIVTPLPVKNIIQPNISTETLLINSDISLFASLCCKKTDKTNLRFGLKDIFKIYEIWCKINGKKCLKTQKKFKEEFEKINYREEKSKGVNINNNPGKRGYNIMVSL
jgi:hypothetical protein